jgi:hypothetical protein
MLLTISIDVHVADHGEVAGELFPLLHCHILETHARWVIDLLVQVVQLVFCQLGLGALEPLMNYL